MRRGWYAGERNSGKSMNSRISLEIDVCLVAARRPNLLKSTLDSFGERLFHHFAVRSFIANVDPIWGGQAEADACVDVIRTRFPGADITQPSEPSFGQAVKTIWSKASDRLVFHLEDDWEALDDITPELLLPHLTPDVGMVLFAHKPRRPEDTDDDYQVSKRKFLGLTIGRRCVNGFGTSPRFIAAGLAPRYAELLDPKLDPCKQVWKEINMPLVRAQQPYKCRKLWRADSSPMIRDTGRDWRVDRKIEKVAKGAAFSWVQKD